MPRRRPAPAGPSLTLGRAALAKALSAVAGVAAAGDDAPILGQLRAQAQGDALTLIGTDLDVEATLVLPGITVETPGTFTMPAALAELVKRLPEDTVSLEHADGRLTVRSGGHRSLWPTLPPEDFPAWAQPAWDAVFEIGAQALLSLLNRVRYAISAEEERYYLNGICLHPDGGVLKAAATDGHRIAVAEVPLPVAADAAAMPRIILPRKTVSVLRAWLHEAGEATVEVSVAATGIRVDCDDRVLRSRLIDGTFPDYHAIVPAPGAANAFTAPVGTLAKALARIAAATGAKSSAVGHEIRDGRLRLSAACERAEIEETLDADGRGAGALGFNAKYLGQALEQIAAGTAQVEFADPAAPARITDPDDPSTVHVLMPMRM